MRRTGHFVVGLASALVCIGAASAVAQAPGQYGARVGNTYLPSTHDAGCGGLLCSSVPVDPANPSRQLPPPPCEGLLCSLTPYSMQPPGTAAEAAAVERQRAAAAAAPPAEEATAPTRHPRKHKRKLRAAAAAAPRTPAPAESAR